jgi:hypothetical protein
LLFEKLIVPGEAKMQIWESKSFGPTSFDGLGAPGWDDVPFAFGSNSYAEILNVEVEPRGRGLEVLRIGARSPLRRLRPLGTLTMQGLVESGDSIVAIDGVSISNVWDLEKLVATGRNCEITIFDHRTRLTVSWQIHVRGMLEAI